MVRRMLCYYHTMIFPINETIFRTLFLEELYFKIRSVRIIIKKTEGLKSVEISILDSKVELDVCKNSNNWTRDCSSIIFPENEVNGLLLDIVASS